MHWVIQDNLFNEAGFRHLITALQRLGIEYSTHKVIPYAEELVPDFEAGDRRVIAMGSYTLARIAEQRGWEPGSFVGNLNYEVQRVCGWGTEMLNSDGLVTRFADVVRFEGLQFVRPVDDGKAFSGAVFDWAGFSEGREEALARGRAQGATVSEDTLVMVCSLKKIYRETRVWIVNSEVVTASCYKLGSSVMTFDADKETIDYAARLAKQWSPNAAYCMDIASTDAGLKIIEVNNLNSSGFYGAEMQKLVIALETAFGGRNGH